jgi:hypothetical protein
MTITQTNAKRVGRRLGVGVAAGAAALALIFGSSAAHASGPIDVGDGHVDLVFTECEQDGQDLFFEVYTFLEDGEALLTAAEVEDYRFLYDLDGLDGDYYTYTEGSGANPGFFEFPNDEDIEDELPFVGFANDEDENCSSEGGLLVIDLADAAAGEDIVEIVTPSHGSTSSAPSNTGTIAIPLGVHTHAVWRFFAPDDTGGEYHLTFNVTLDGEPYDAIVPYSFLITD